MFCSSLALRGLFFGVFFREMTPDHAAADRTHDGVMARVMSGHAAHDRAFDTAGGVGGSGSGQPDESGRDEQGITVIELHCLPME